MRKISILEYKSRRKTSFKLITIYDSLLSIYDILYIILSTILVKVDVETTN